MDYRWFCLGVFWLFAAPALAQEGKDNGSVPFLNISPDARSSGMGGVGVSIPNGAFAMFHNPSSRLFSDRTLEFAYTHTPWMREWSSDYTLNSFGGYYTIDRQQGVAVGFRHFSHPGVETTDKYGDVRGKIKPREWTADISYNRRIIKNLALSVSLRYISSDMGESGNAVAFDLGAYYQQQLPMREGSRWSVGVLVANIGSKIRYSDTSYDLPGKIKAGGCVWFPFTDKHALQCALDLEYRLMPSDATAMEARLGVEYHLLKYARIRAGIHLGDKEKGSGNYASLGCGFQVFHITGDFSYVLADSDSSAKNSYSFTVGIFFDSFKNKAKGLQ